MITFLANAAEKTAYFFKKALAILEKLVNQTQELSLITDGERRYGNILFEICHDNFMRSHFTTNALGILDKALSWQELLMLPVAV